MLMSLRDVARMLDITVMRIEYATRAGVIPPWTKWRGKRYYDAEQFEVIADYFANHEPGDPVVPVEKGMVK